MAYLIPLEGDWTPRNWGLKVLEEASELCESLKILHRDLAKDKDNHLRDRAIYEACDVLQVVAGCLDAMGVTEYEFERHVYEMQKCNSERGRHEKEGAKTLAVDWGEHD